MLIVEDDRALGQYLRRGMEMEGHVVCWAGDGDEAISAVMEQPPDLLLLDLNLPKRDGTEVLEMVHRMHAGVCVMVLTGRGELEERVRCLDMGADDCMVKPFSFRELAARCRALLRRSSKQADPVLRCGSLVLNRMERTVECEGRPVGLTVKEFALLEYLLRHRGNCVPRGALLEEVWRMSPDAGTNVVDVYINYLRRKLADGKAFIPGDTALTGGEWIETVRGAGYRLRDAAGEREAGKLRAAAIDSEGMKRKPTRSVPLPLQTTYGRLQA